jgi:hypothetical protein
MSRTWQRNPIDTDQLQPNSNSLHQSQQQSHRVRRFGAGFCVSMVDTTDLADLSLSEDMDRSEGLLVAISVIVTASP